MVPQVITVGTGAGWPPERRTVATERTTRSYCSNRCSCASCRGWKNDPDCRKSPSRLPACRRWACSIASAPRLAPIPTVRVVATFRAQAGEDRQAQRPGVRAVAGVAVVARSRREEGGAHRRQRPRCGPG